MGGVRLIHYCPLCVNVCVSVPSDRLPSNSPRHTHSIVHAQKYLYIAVADVADVADVVEKGKSVLPRVTSSG